MDIKYVRLEWDKLHRLPPEDRAREALAIQDEAKHLQAIVRAEAVAEMLQTRTAAEVAEELGVERSRVYQLKKFHEKHEGERRA